MSAAPRRPSRTESYILGMPYLGKAYLISSEARPSRGSPISGQDKPHTGQRGSGSPNVRQLEPVANFLPVKVTFIEQLTRDIHSVSRPRRRVVRSRTTSSAMFSPI